MEDIAKQITDLLYSDIEIDLKTKEACYYQHVDGIIYFYSYDGDILEEFNLNGEEYDFGVKNKLDTLINKEIKIKPRKIMVDRNIKGKHISFYDKNDILMGSRPVNQRINSSNYIEIIENLNVDISEMEDIDFSKSQNFNLFSEIFLKK